MAIYDTLLWLKTLKLKPWIRRHVKFLLDGYPLFFAMLVIVAICCFTGSIICRLVKGVWNGMLEMPAQIKAEWLDLVLIYKGIGEILRDEVKSRNVNNE